MSFVYENVDQIDLFIAQNLKKGKEKFICLPLPSCKNRV